MPDFTIRGNPGAIRSRAATTSEKGKAFYDTGDALARIDTSGWIGRAADTFRDAHDLEPERWTKAGNGFRKAGAALTAYADAVEHAQAVAEWVKREWDRGNDVTENARARYDADVSQAKAKLASGEYSSLTIEPFQDPGKALRDNALSELAKAKADLENAAHLCAGQVRAGCADAPEEPEWWESGLRFVGGVFQGAGEAVWDLLTMVPFSPINMVIDFHSLATGDLTPEELAKKYELAGENAMDMAKGIYHGVTTDPMGFGKELGKSLLDWDTWADDPARAIGHLVPDAIATVATAGAGSSLRALRGLDGLHDISMLSRPMHGLQSLRGVDVGDLTGLSRMGDAEFSRFVNGLDPADQARLLRRGAEPGNGTFADVFGKHTFTTDYRRVSDTYAGAPTTYDSVPRSETLVNLHARDNAGSGTFWTDPAEAAGTRTEQQALDRLALERSWYTSPEGVYTPRDEITVRDFTAGEPMRVQEGTIGPQPTTPGGATQHVMGLDEPFYSSGNASQWTGPAPWVEATPEGAWRGFAEGAGVGLGGSLLAGSAAEESNR